MAIMAINRNGPGYETPRLLKEHEEGNARVRVRCLGCKEEDVVEFPGDVTEENAQLLCSCGAILWPVDAWPSSLLEVSEEVAE